MDMFYREPKIVQAREVRRWIRELAKVTRVAKGQKSVWLDRGNILPRQRGTRWLVLHQVPPRAYAGSTGEEREAAELLRTYQPEYFVSGHSHQYPYLAGNGWAQTINGVRVLVPGQLLDAAFPSP
jgi:hypothetical protein